LTNYKTDKIPKQSLATIVLHPSVQSTLTDSTLVDFV